MAQRVGRDEDDNCPTGEEKPADDDKPLVLPILNNPPFKHHKPSQQQTNAFFKPRDPRFDAKCAGSNDVRHFVRNYAFLDEIQQDELNQLKQALRKEKDAEKREKIKVSITRIENKIVDRQNKVKKIETIHELRRSVRNNPQQATASQAGTPNDTRDNQRHVPPKKKYANVKKSDIKKQLIVNKYKELKESGKLSKYLERKRKKLINRDGKAFEG